MEKVCDFTKQGIELEEAWALLSASARPLEAEKAPPEKLPGRVLAEAVFAPLNQPPFDRSPLDGYALHAADTALASRENPALLLVADRLFAGDCPKKEIRRGQAARIMTGAMLPAGCDSVVRQEDTDCGNEQVKVFTPILHHQNYCFSGEDFKKGALLIAKNTKIDAAAFALLHSAGLCGPKSAFQVYRQPRAAVFSTGDELFESGVSPLPAGKIYDSNLAFVTARLAQLSAKVVCGARLPDEPAIVAAALRKACEKADLIVTTGGVSVGQKDIFHEALVLLGAEKIFWRVNMKPGTPALFSTFQGVPILSLSGNPFAAAATFELLCRPLLYALYPDETLPLQKINAPCESAFLKKSGVRRFVRGRWQAGALTLPEGHSSGQLASMVGCNCLAEVPAGSGPVLPGRQLPVYLL